MTRFLFALGAILLVCAAFAAPAPDPFRSGWSIPVDPNRDCKISRPGGALTIEMPGTEHDYDPIRERFNAPRILRDIEGDFDIQIHVHIERQPSAEPTVQGQPSCVSGGILLIYPDTFNSICDRFEFGLSQPAFERAGAEFAPRLLLPRRENKVRKATGEAGYVANKTFWCRELTAVGKRDLGSVTLTQTICDPGWSGWSLPYKTDHAYLRIEQSDRWLSFYVSDDGERWTFLVQGRSKPLKRKLGLAAYSTSTEPSKVRFDQLKLNRRPVPPSILRGDRRNQI